MVDAERRRHRSRVGFTPWDADLRRRLMQLHELTHRPILIYYSDWLGSTFAPEAAIDLGDLQGVVEVLSGRGGGEGLDVVLHMPGGSPEATTSIVHYLRSEFAHVRVFVPLAAMSAATMLALSANEIVMGSHSQLGPTDPQVVTRMGTVAAHAVVRQFRRAQGEIAADHDAVGVWVPTLQQYAPGLLELCEQVSDQVRRVVAEWLGTYMFGGTACAKQKARKVARYFCDGMHRSHARGIFREEAAAQGIAVVNLEDDQALYDTVLHVHRAGLAMLQGSGSVKIIASHDGSLYAVPRGPEWCWRSGGDARSGPVARPPCCGLRCGPDRLCGSRGGHHGTAPAAE